MTIGSTSTRRVASANRGAGSLENPDGTAGAGGTTTIRCSDVLDPTDTSIMTFDSAGGEHAAPVWLILGHELIHAQHNAAGRNRRNLPAVGGAAWASARRRRRSPPAAG